MACLGWSRVGLSLLSRGSQAYQPRAILRLDLSKAPVFRSVKPAGLGGLSAGKSRPVNPETYVHHQQRQFFIFQQSGCRLSGISRPPPSPETGGQYHRRESVEPGRCRAGRRCGSRRRQQVNRSVGLPLNCTRRAFPRRGARLFLWGEARTHRRGASPGPRPYFTTGR